MITDPDLKATLQVAQATTERGLLRAAFDRADVAMIAIDEVTLRFVSANCLGLELLDIPMRSVIRMGVEDYVSRAQIKRLRRIGNWIKGRSSKTASLRMWDGDRWQSITATYVISRQPTFLISIKENVDPAYSESEAISLLTTAIESLSDGFVLYDQDDRLVICNEKYKEIYEASADSMLPGATFESILRYGLDNAQYADGIGREEEWLHQRLQAHAAANSTVEQELSDGTWLRIVERTTKDGGRVGLRIDITELKEQQEKLRLAARTDNLTGALNRQGLYEDLAEISKTVGPDERVAILHIDLDKFKSINDAQGHLAGDFVLRHCVRILNNLDVDRKLVARVGGDEFIITMVTTQATEGVVGFAQRIIRSLSHPVTFQERPCNVGASIGIAFFHPCESTSMEEALTGADIALNNAKLTGCGVARVIEDSMRRDTLSMIQMAQQIRSGLQEAQFEPFYQPQIDTATGVITGFESLIRWRHPTMGMVPAFRFLEAAEWAGLMDELDRVIIDRSCFAASQIQSWGMRDMKVSINMSLGQLRDPGMLDRLLRYCELYAIKPTDLRIELLESILLDDRSTVITQNVQKFIENGIAVELDDFGTGHAAIATLRKFKVSRIKIDRSLVQNIDSDPELQVITGAIIELADRLEISPLAEGVETEAEQATLQDLGCTFAQGYLHAKPMPLAQLRAWITAHLARHSDARSAQKPASA